MTEQQQHVEGQDTEARLARVADGVRDLQRNLQRLRDEQAQLLDGVAKLNAELERQGAGLMGRNAKAGRNAEIAARVRDGENIAALAAEYGLTRQRISAIAKAAGVPPRPHSYHGGPEHMRRGMRRRLAGCMRNIARATPETWALRAPTEREPAERDGVALIAAERRRQVEEEGWTPEHDDGHRYGELAIAAARYAVHGTDARVVHPDGEDDPTIGWLKFDGDVRELVKAGALIAAEIDRLLRRAEPQQAEAEGSEG